MPRNRNRTVTNNLELPPEFLKTLPYPEELNLNGQKPNVSNVNQFCFEEPIASQVDKSNRNGDVKIKFNSSSSSDYDNITSGVSDIEIISFGKSSSSSVSWSDEFDTEATQHVQNEFDRMERVLQGREPIPPHYNHDEYEQWIKTFPQLSVTGQKMKYPMQPSFPNRNSHDDYEEIIAINSDLSYLMGNCDKEPTSVEAEKIDNIKNTVIDQVFQSISSKLLDKKPIDKCNGKGISKNYKHLEQKAKPVITNNTQNLAAQVNSFLRISPVLLQESSTRSNYLDTREHSSHSVSKSDKLASKWMKEEPIEYSSLPYLTIASAKNKSHKAVRHKNSTSGRSRYSSKLSPKINPYVSLPPINASSLPLANQYRSISATPRQPLKGSFAASAQVGSTLTKKILGFEVTNYLTQTGLEPRKTIVKHRK